MTFVILKSEIHFTLSLQDGGVSATASRYVKAAGTKPGTQFPSFYAPVLFFNITVAIYLLSMCILRCYYTDYIPHVAFNLKMYPKPKQHRYIQS